MEIYLNLLLVGLVPVALTILVYLLKKKTPFAKLSYWKQQLIIGGIFGVASILGTVLGVGVGGNATANARDAAPITAGLIFGGPAGIIAGIIGGAYRFVATYWGAGAYSQIACTVSTIFAGFYAALLRKYIFNNDRPNIVLGFATGLVMEVFHMTVLFLTKINDISNALPIVKICTIPMIVCNSVSILLSILLMDILEKRRIIKKNEDRPMSIQIQSWLLLFVIVAYAVSTVLVYQFQTTILKKQAKDTLTYSLEDMVNDFNEGEISATNMSHNRAVGLTGYSFVANSSHKIISDGFGSDSKYLNQNLTTTGITNIKNYKEYELIKYNVCGQESYCMYTFYDNYIIIVVLNSKEIFQTREDSLYINSYMEILVFATLFIVIYVLINKKIVKRLIVINKDLGKIIDGDLSVEVKEKSNQEIKQLAGYINSTVDTLKDMVEEANKRMDKELAFARSIQHSALPSIFPAFPYIKSFDIYATMNTAKEVGGDFYDFYMLGENRLAFLIADVSGKGVPAAMFMMRAKTVIKSLAETGIPVNEVLTKANDKLSQGNDAGMFVTVWMGILDINTGHVEYANCGHNPPIVQRNGKYEYLKGKSGLVLAGMEGVSYSMQTIDLDEEDKIFLYTDGITEANNVKKEMYGENRLLEYINKHPSDNLKEVLSGIEKDVDDFAGDEEQFDDMTMLLINFKGKGNKTILEEKVFDASEKFFPYVLEFIEGKLDEFGVSKKDKMQIAIASEEIFVNVAHYAYQDRKGDIKIGIGIREDAIKMVFTDSGIPFNPLKKSDPDITLSAEDRQVGGLGIFMVRKTMDSVEYSNILGKNILTIRKKITRE